MKLFNRRDAQVEANAKSMTEEDFVKEYKETAATELVLRSVWVAFNKVKAREAEIKKDFKDATAFVETTAQICSDDKGNPDSVMLSTSIKDKATLKTKRTFVETVDSNLRQTVIDGMGKTKRGKNVIDEEEGEVVVQKDKPGRTPRMRELIGDKKFGKDKAKVKAQLIEEGFSCEGSGFHSEWNRVSKSVK